MLPPRALSADSLAAPDAVAAAIEAFVAEHPEAAVLEDGKVIFELKSAKHTVSAEHGRCTLHLWSDDRNLVRTVVNATSRAGSLRLATTRFGHVQPKLLELVARRERRTPTTRETARQCYMKLLARVLAREFHEWTPEGFRAAMDLERSFGPAYVRGSLVRGKQAWAVIGVSGDESATTIDGVLTLGLLWFDHCRAQAAGRVLYQGLRVVVPRGAAMLTASRMAWLNASAGVWELYELNEATEELVQHDLDDTGNLRTRLVHHPDEAAARERFAHAIEDVMSLLPEGEEHRVDQHLRSPAELVFLLHGLVFAHARVSLAANSFAQALEVTVGAGSEETPLTEGNREQMAERVAELFARRKAVRQESRLTRQPLSRRIGQATGVAAHSRMERMYLRAGRGANSAQDPLYRAAPERWLESVLRRDLAPLTRGLAAAAKPDAVRARVYAAGDDDTFGNRATPSAGPEVETPQARVIPRFDPRFVYAQVPAIAGASDRGMLDLLGVTLDGRLAVIELKADEDLQFALQGLDYWIRVRQHHVAQVDSGSGLGEFQRHGYFVGVELSPEAPRLYLVAPALRIHPATEVVLRYFSPRVPWQLLALDERWREQVRVVWRKGKEQ